jgi:hypothetical protein
MMCEIVWTEWIDDYEHRGPNGRATSRLAHMFVQPNGSRMACKGPGFCRDCNQDQPVTAV